MGASRKPDPKGRSPGRPRSTDQNALSVWLDEQSLSREHFAALVGTTVAHLNRMCRGARRPSLDLAMKVEQATQGAVPATIWLDVPTHSAD